MLRHDFSKRAKVQIKYRFLKYHFTVAWSNNFPELTSFVQLHINEIYAASGYSISPFPGLVPDSPTKNRKKISGLIMGDYRKWPTETFLPLWDHACQQQARLSS
jgi:hypothetical protein